MHEVPATDKRQSTSVIKAILVFLKISIFDRLVIFWVFTYYPNNCTKFCLKFAISFAHTYIIVLVIKICTVFSNPINLESPKIGAHASVRKA